MTTKARQPKAVKTALLLVGHGSRVPGAPEILTKVASAIKRRHGKCVVEAAFLEITEPDLQTGIDRCVEAGAERVLIVPYFLYLGGHVGRDLPDHMGQARLRYPKLEIRIAPHLGYDPRIVAVTSDRIKQGLRAGRWS
jgi:sirohydrochlorin ferrochelatase